MKGDFRKSMIEKVKAGDWPYRYFHKIPTLSGLDVSVQAHAGAYCIPTTNDGGPYDYTHFEVAIMYPPDDNAKAWFQPKHSAIFPDHLKNKWEHGEKPVAAYLTVEEVQEVFDILNDHDHAPAWPK